jgi:DnaK suppressor protein
VNARDLQRYKRLLLAKLGELPDTGAGLASPLMAAEALRGDLVDQANAGAEAELHVHLHKSDGRLLRAIEEALARLRAGTFGVCETCKSPISKARLEAVPWTRVCRDCKEREQSAA